MNWSFLHFFDKNLEIGKSKIIAYDFCHLFLSGFLCPTSRMKILNKLNQWKIYTNQTRGPHDRMVVGFTTTCAISAYRHLRCEFEPRSWQGDKSLWVTCDKSVVSSTNKTEILSKVVLKHHKPPNHFCHLFFSGFLCVQHLG